jgi:hypothetical protein
VTLDEALRRLYGAHGLPSDGGESSKWFHVRIGPVSIPLPNPPARQRVLFIHDTNHVLTGYNARFSDGEMSIAAFEVGAGCGRAWVAWFFNLMLLALGAFVRPRAVLHAFVRGRRSESLYTRSETRAELRRMQVEELRALIRLDREAAFARPDDLLALGTFVVLTWLTAGAIVVAAASGLWALVR